jgi:uncharacterized protein (DUF111 family)
VHLDLVGGLSGDMFAAALLDAFPAHEARVCAAVDAVLAEDTSFKAMLVRHRDGLLHGRRFLVEHAERHGAHREAAPRLRWHELRDGLERGAALPAAVRRNTLCIFRLLAEAEARVHGIPADEVSFRETGARDLRADIVAAATLIDAIGASRWTTSPLPLGDDRVTRTGASILRYLCTLGEPRPSSAVRTLHASGTGFGGRRIPGISNHIRVLVFTSKPESDDLATHEEHWRRAQVRARTESKATGGDLS